MLVAPPSPLPLFQDLREKHALLVGGYNPLYLVLDAREGLTLLVWVLLPHLLVVPPHPLLQDLREKCVLPFGGYPPPFRLAARRRRTLPVRIPCLHLPGICILGVCPDL